MNLILAGLCFGIGGLALVISDLETGGLALGLLIMGFVWLGLGVLMAVWGPRP